MTKKAQPSLFAPFGESDDNELVPGYRRPATAGAHLDDLNEALPAFTPRASANLRT